MKRHEIYGLDELGQGAPRPGGEGRRMGAVAETLVKLSWIRSLSCQIDPYSNLLGDHFHWAVDSHFQSSGLQASCSWEAVLIGFMSVLVFEVYSQAPRHISGKIFRGYVGVKLEVIIVWRERKA